jgi:hypothetical protein
VRYNNKQTSKPLSFGLAMTAGIGVIVMIFALATGVVQGADADSRAISLTLVTGFTLLAIGFVGWLIIVRPFDHFDDINVPKEMGHGHGEHETAIVAHDSDAEHAVEPVSHH